MPYKCPVCKKSVDFGCAIACDYDPCKRWFHYKCLNFSANQFNKLRNKTAGQLFSCPRCYLLISQKLNNFNIFQTNDRSRKNLSNLQLATESGLAIVGMGVESYLDQSAIKKKDSGKLTDKIKPKNQKEAECLEDGELKSMSNDASTENQNDSIPDISAQTKEAVHQKIVTGKTPLVDYPDSDSDTEQAIIGQNYSDDAEIGGRRLSESASNSPIQYVDYARDYAGKSSSNIGGVIYEGLNSGCSEMTDQDQVTSSRKILRLKGSGSKKRELVKENGDRLKYNKKSYFTIDSKETNIYSSKKSKVAKYTSSCPANIEIKKKNKEEEKAEKKEKKRPRTILAR